MIVTNHINWHRENLQSDREIPVDLKIQFLWVSCIMGSDGCETLQSPSKGDQPSHLPAAHSVSLADYFFIIAASFNQLLGLRPPLRIDYCDQRVIQESSYISGAIPLTHTYYISYEGRYFSVLDHTSNI